MATILPAALSHERSLPFSTRCALIDTLQKITNKVTKKGFNRFFFIYYKFKITNHNYQTQIYKTFMKTKTSE